MKHCLKEVLLCVNNGLFLCVLVCKGKISKCWVISQHCNITTPSNTGQFFNEIIKKLTSLAVLLKSYFPNTLVPGDNTDLCTDECNIKSIHLIENVFSHNKYKLWTMRSKCYKIAFIVWTNVYHLDKYKIDEIKSLLCECNFSYYHTASAVA